MLKLKEYLKVSYRIEQNSILFFKNVNLVKNETQQIWECSFKKEDDIESWIVTIKNSKVVSQNDHDVQNIVDMSQILNQPFDELSLLLDYQGSISEVLNKNEIWDKWKSLKKQLENYVDNAPEIKKVMKQCDVDFKQPTDKIRRSLLYFLIFSPVYYGQGNSMKRNLLFPSVINSGEVLSNSVYQKLISFDDNEYTFGLSADSTYYGISNLKKKFENELSKHLQGSFDYFFSLDAKNVYEINTGLLTSSMASIKEQASTDFYYNHSVNIRKIDVL